MNEDLKNDWMNGRDNPSWREYFTNPESRRMIILFRKLLREHNAMDINNAFELAIFSQARRDVGFIKRQFNSEAIKKIEEKCPAVYDLIRRKELGHEDRLTISQLYSMLPGGAERIHVILSNQKNYNEHITQTQIEAAQKKKINAPNCDTMEKKGYCLKIHSKRCDNG